MIQIWMNRIGSVWLAFCSECSAPEPSVIRWTEPAGSGPGAPPTSSWWRNIPSTTYVRPSMSRWGCIGQIAPGIRRSSLNTRIVPKLV